MCGFLGVCVCVCVNLLASLARDICEECMSACAPEQLRLPVSRAAGRCWSGSLHPTRLVWQRYDTTDSNGVSVAGSQFNRAQSPACWWAATDAVAAQWGPRWQMKSSILGLSADIKIKEREGKSSSIEHQSIKMCRHSDSARSLQEWRFSQYPSKKIIKENKPDCHGCHFINWAGTLDRERMWPSGAGGIC